jgi:predicted amidohydrolase
MSTPSFLRLAVAQSTLRPDPRSISELRESGLELRRLMQEARVAGARMVQFPEGATCSPNKRIISVDGPETVGPADWDRAEWGILREELRATAEAARDLQLWTVLGSVHRLTPPHRPHNSLYVISDRGEIVTRYDERMLSKTKISFMYTPGSGPVTFEVDGVRFGCTLGMEAHFPELFGEYERLDVDCVLVSSTGVGTPYDGVFALEAQGYAATNSYWVSYSTGVEASAAAPSGVIGPGGRWQAQCSRDGVAAVVVADLDLESRDFVETRLSRPWRRVARGGIYDPHVVRDDPRSEDRSAF